MSVAARGRRRRSNTNTASAAEPTAAETPKTVPRVTAKVCFLKFSASAALAMKTPHVRVPLVARAGTSPYLRWHVPNVSTVRGGGGVAAACQGNVWHGWPPCESGRRRLHGAPWQPCHPLTWRGAVTAIVTAAAGVKDGLSVRPCPSSISMWHTHRLGRLRPATCGPHSPNLAGPLRRRLVGMQPARAAALLPAHLCRGSRSWSRTWQHVVAVGKDGL